VWESLFSRSVIMIPPHHLTRTNTQASSADSSVADRPASYTNAQETRHQATAQQGSTQTTTQVPPPVPPVTPHQTRPTSDGTTPPQTAKKKGHGALIIAFVFALIVSIMLLFYSKRPRHPKNRGQRYAIRSHDPRSANISRHNMDSPTDNATHHCTP
jgi:sensor c-di-GMP phosphodiesterase-like protein